MPSYKLVLFSDNINQQYMSEQKKAIENAIPSLVTELSDSDDSRLALYAKHPNRMPCLMLFKDDARMQSRHTKRSHEEIINWIKTIIPDA